MDSKNNCASVLSIESPHENSSAMTRRDFAKKAAGAGAISVFALMSLPQLAYAWMDGKFYEREDLGDGLKALVKTYSITDPYPLKFNDGLVKIHLQSLDFAVRKELKRSMLNILPMS